MRDQLAGGRLLVVRFDRNGALREAGPDGLERRALGTRVNCRQWGPGRYRRALGIAERRGDILRTGRSRFVAG